MEQKCRFVVRNFRVSNENLKILDKFANVFFRFCMTVDGQEVEVVAKEATETSESTAETSGENCHFHAGVECVYQRPTGKIN